MGVTASGMDSAAPLDYGARPPPIPQYSLYGEKSVRPSGWFVSMEPLAQRCEARGWTIEPHSHPNFVQMVVVRSGYGTLQVEGQSVAFHGPAILTIPALTVHGFVYEEHSDGWVVTVADSYLQELLTRAPVLEEIWQEPHCIDCSDSLDDFSALEAAINRLYEELEGIGPARNVATEASLLTVLVSLLRQLRGRNSTVPTPLNGQMHLLKRYISAIELHYKDNWDLARYADELNTTHTRLRLACRNISGNSPIKILNNRIILEAKRVLSYTDLSVSEIAYLLGFEDPSYFTRFFREREGVTPSQYRLQDRDHVPAPALDLA